MNQLRIDRLDPETGHTETITGAAAAVAVMHDATVVLNELARKLGLGLIAISASQDPDHGRVTIGATMESVRKIEDRDPGLLGLTFVLGGETYEITAVKYRFPGAGPSWVKCRTIPDDGLDYGFPASIVEEILDRGNRP